jgi:thiamine biosynthesis lipoprotein
MASTTQVTLVDSEPAAADWAEHRLHELEQRWSRFLPTSDITIINQKPGTWVRVTDDTIRLIHAMQLASTATAGAYDPTFLHQLLTSGYDVSIDDPDRITLAVDTPSTSRSVHDVQLDSATSSVLVPVGLSLDPGGIGKGFAADLVVTELLAAGVGGALVSVGGDIAAAGTAPQPEGWRVHVEDPLRSPAIALTIAVSAGGVATSSTRSRRWLHGGSERHHIIDPATGEQSLTDVATATVVATAGWLAEAHATAAILPGAADAIAYLEASGLSGVVIDRVGTITTTPDITTPDIATPDIATPIHVGAVS